MKKIDKNITLNEWFTIWINDYKANISAKTKFGYNVCYKKIADSIGLYNVNELRQMHFQEVFLELNDCGYSKHTIRQIKMVTRMLLQAAVENDLILKNPVQSKYIGTNESDRGKALTHNEQQMLIAYIRETNHEYEEMIVLLLLSGLRSAEARALTWLDINLDKKVLIVNKSIRENPSSGRVLIEINKPKTKSSIRNIPLNDQAIFYLQKLKKKNINITSNTKLLYGDLIFTKNGKIITSGDMYYIFVKLTKSMNKAGYKISKLHPHRLRNTFASNCYEAGVSIKFISEVLGHKSTITSLNIYVNPSNEHLHEEINKI